jgi:hypothetical protein
MCFRPPKRGWSVRVSGQKTYGSDLKRRQELIERFDLDPSKKARAYSKGNRHKVALITASWPAWLPCAVATSANRPLACVPWPTTLKRLWRRGPRCR